MSRSFQALAFDGEGNLRNGWWILAWLLLLRLVQGALFSMVGPWAFGEISFRLLDSASMVLVTGLCLRLQRRPFREVGVLPNRPWLQEALLGLSLGIGLMLTTALLLWALGGFHWEREARSLGQGLPRVLTLCLAVALVEELYYRGYLFRRLAEGLTPGAAQAMFGLYFAWGHWSNPGLTVGTVRLWATVNIALAAVLLGLAALRTGSLALPIGLHFGWNWAQGWLLGFPVSGTRDLQGPWRVVLHDRPHWVTGGDFGLEGSLLCALVTLGAIGLLARWKPLSADPSTGGAPAGPP